ncbi:PRC-barrel domain-containing protein [Arsukibacterium sp.]|uniref:PRC-barrel domain-containing protein n=1 Tax=Arsukibacterium sp. TaxID=1977258 RepID=UPI00299CD542|nr:PRC-barrel domain-containing protein [Arsukibacterium sp.]MDX1538045.1 PRC-barrel domain-containing protein [Arsukibacterium sp.]
MSYLKKTALVSCVACALALPVTATADDHMIKASNIIYSDITNGLNTFGRIENVLLNRNSDAVEYLFFETSNTFRPVSNTKGFVEISNVKFNADAGGKLQVLVKDTNAQRKPQELEVTHKEAEYRLVSKILDEYIMFSDQQMRQIDDILIDRKTGKIKYFTVDMATDGFFSDDIRAIPADEVHIKWSGQVKSSASLTDVSSHKKYQMGSM